MSFDICTKSLGELFLFFLIISGDMEEYDVDEIKQFIQENPLHPRSAHLIFSLCLEDQRNLILSIVENATFCDSWEAYFKISIRDNVDLSSNVAFEAVRNVGVDPMSANLWIAAANACPREEETREIFRLGLAVPLFEWDLLCAAYLDFEQKCQRPIPQLKNDFLFLSSEKWPDRYKFPMTELEQSEIYQQWQALLYKMEADLNSEEVDCDLQYHRIEMALRQMCVQLPTVDSCYFQYAFFQVKVLDDIEGAISTLTGGIKKVGEHSFGLENFLSVLTTNDTQSTLDSLKAKFSSLASMRCIADALSSQSSKEFTKELRTLGKAAASGGLCDWKIYSQWCQAEHLRVRNSSMAARVLENGFICCSDSPEDGILLTNESVFHHLIQRNEKEALVSVEQLLNVSRKSEDYGRSMEAWNKLVRVENKLRSFSSAAENRRNKEFQKRSYLEFLLDKYRVGIFSPCSSYAAKWIRFSSDFRTSWNHEHNSLYNDTVPSAKKAISFPKWEVNQDILRPNTSEWEPLKVDSKVKILDSEDPDEIFGVRSNRGRWIFHVHLDDMTSLRLKKQQRLAASKKSDVLVSQRDSPIGRLAHRLKLVVFTPDHSRKEGLISFDWLSRVLAAELNLNSPKGNPVR